MGEPRFLKVGAVSSAPARMHTTSSTLALVSLNGKPRRPHSPCYLLNWITLRSDASSLNVTLDLSGRYVGSMMALPFNSRRASDISQLLPQTLVVLTWKPHKLAIQNQMGGWMYDLRCAVI